jgi:Reverse transcriptase (RNA-dependent DNA polymerase)
VRDAARGKRYATGERTDGCWVSKTLYHQGRAIWKGGEPFATYWIIDCQVSRYSKGSIGVRTLADKRSTNEFGIDAVALNSLDWPLAANRVLADVRSDFIYAPHISNIFRHAANDLITMVATELKSGRFAPSRPITIEVPKSSRMQAVPRGSRGPSFSRPGSILLPKDRLLYQVLADNAAPIIESHTDRKRSFSHQLAGHDSPEMFEPSRASWNKMQQALDQLAKQHAKSYVVKADIANCFETINQHTLVNHLDAIGYPSSLKGALDAFLVLVTGDRNSRGLLQGLFPSDLLGNFYLNPIDEHFKDLEIPSARYVDDIYLFVSSLRQAEEVTRILTSKLRDYDLGLNEYKSKLLQSNSLIIEEPDLERLFADAFNERLEQLEEDEKIDSDYGFQSEWEDDDDESEVGRKSEAELHATEVLFDSMDDFPPHIEKIERFCLPLFAAAVSEYAVDYVLENFAARPAMTQIYCAYLAKFSEDAKIASALEKTLTNDQLLYDWQRMWVFAALMRWKKTTDEVVRIALKTYNDGSRHEGLRAVAAILTAKHGSFTRQKQLVDNYGNTGSAYLQAAVLYATRYFQKELRRSSVKSWSAHTATHSLVAKSISGLGR